MAASFLRAWVLVSLAQVAPAFRSTPRSRQITRFRAIPGTQIQRVENSLEYFVFFDGPASNNGQFGKIVYDKILRDQKEIHRLQPAVGFSPGVIPPFIMPRILYASVKELCKELCKAALEENGIVPDEKQDTIELSFPGAEDGDIPTFCKKTGYKPGDNITFKAGGVKCLQPKGGPRFSQPSDPRASPSIFPGIFPNDRD